MISDKSLYILWANADINTSLYMVLMYAENSLSHAWWDKVTVIIWGAPAKLVRKHFGTKRNENCHGKRCQIQCLHFMCEKIRGS